MTDHPKPSERLEELFGSQPGLNDGWRRWQALKAWADERFLQPEAPPSNGPIEIFCFFCKKTHRQVKNLVCVGGTVSADASLGGPAICDECVATAARSIPAEAPPSQVEVPATDNLGDRTEGQDDKAWLDNMATELLKRPFEPAPPLEEVCENLRDSMTEGFELRGKRIAELEAELAGRTEQRNAWAKQCNLSSEESSALIGSNGKLTRERDQLQERLRLWEATRESLMRSASAWESEANNASTVSGGRHMLKMCSETVRASLPKPTPLTPGGGQPRARQMDFRKMVNGMVEGWISSGKATVRGPYVADQIVDLLRSVTRKETRDGSESEHERRHDSERSAKGGEHEPQPREPGLAGRAPSAADDHPSAEGRTENAGALAGDHEAGRSPDVGRRSDDGGVAEPPAGEPVVPVGESPAPEQHEWRPSIGPRGGTGDLRCVKCGAFPPVDGISRVLHKEHCPGRAAPTPPAPPSPAVPDVKRALELLREMRRTRALAWTTDQVNGLDAAIVALGGDAVPTGGKPDGK